VNNEVLIEALAERVALQAGASPFSQRTVRSAQAEKIRLRNGRFAGGFVLGRPPRP